MGIELLFQELFRIPQIAEQARNMPMEPFLQEFFQIPRIAELRITVFNTGLAGTAVGASAMLGGMLFGPAGLAVAGIVGSCMAAYMINGRYKTVRQVYTELTNEEREQFMELLRRFLSSQRVGDSSTFVQRVLSEDNFVQSLIKVLETFLGELHMTIEQ